MKAIIAFEKQCNQILNKTATRTKWDSQALVQIMKLIVADKDINKAQKELDRFIATLAMATKHFGVEMLKAGRIKPTLKVVSSPDKAAVIKGKITFEAAPEFKEGDLAKWLIKQYDLVPETVKKVGDTVVWELDGTVVTWL